ncbi:hypothetical protein BDW02DRAFT_573078 [Decorospora gaudefroyi]|uniref:Uncharacterized protein n=1 Tax=Decorospora gaudefroyi TaxID=184978 RepID=A0A6A5K774_9PLEO|nr:hypothetical protein BDW02DRAFT_573078 [Decorospora gaudefroyi]
MAPLTPLNNSSARKRRVASPGTGTNPPHVLRDTPIADLNLRGAFDTDQNRLKASVDDKRTTRDRKDVSLLSLPCEILEMVAFKLRGSEHILNFAVANRHVYNLVQKAMVRDLIVSRKHIKQVLGTLARRPDLLSIVTSVDLGDFGCGHGHDQGCSCLGKPNFDPDIAGFIGKTITSNSNNTVNWRDIRLSKYASGPVWRKQQAFFLDVLITLCPNIKAVAVELPQARAFSSVRPIPPTHMPPDPLPAPNPELMPVAPFQGPALQVMQQKLEALTIREDSRWKGPATLEILEAHDITWRNMGKHTITLAGFVRLKRLDIPMEVLGLPYTISFLDPRTTTSADGNETNETQIEANPRTKVLPLTLQYLHLRSCNKSTFAFLQRVNEVPIEDLGLKHIELFFQTGPQNAMNHCDAADEGRLNYLGVLMELRTKGVRVAFYVGPKEVHVDMHKGLTALSALSTFEVLRFSASPMLFAKLNLEASGSRRYLDLHSRLFLRHAPWHFHLLNSPSFCPQSWAKGAFFHGIKNTKWDPKVLDMKLNVRTIDPVKWTRRLRGKCEAKRHLPELLNLDNFQFSLRLERNTTQLLKEVSFPGVMGMTHNLQNGTYAQPTISTRNVKKKLYSVKDEVKGSKQGHWTDRKFQVLKKSSVKSLQREMIELRIESDHGNAVVAPVVAKDSKFSAAGWSGVSWKDSLGLSM